MLSANILSRIIWKFCLSATCANISTILKSNTWLIKTNLFFHCLVTPSIQVFPKLSQLGHNFIFIYPELWCSLLNLYYEIGTLVLTIVKYFSQLTNSLNSGFWSSELFMSLMMSAACSRSCSCSALIGCGSGRDGIRIPSFWSWSFTNLRTLWKHLILITEKRKIMAS